MIKKEIVKITPFGLDRMLHIYLPDDYQTSQKRYPVFYMFDGHNLYNDSDATYGHAWHIADTYEKNGIEMIVVGLECNHEGRERLNEFCPYVCHSSYLGDLDGRGTPLMKWMSTELKDYIDDYYPTNGTNYLGGSSMGGLMAFYGIIAYPDVYQGAACLSSSISLCMEQLLEEIKQMKPMHQHRIYMSYGENEGRNHLAHVVRNHMLLFKALEKQDTTCYLDMIINGDHNEATWEKQVLDYTLYLVK